MKMELLYGLSFARQSWQCRTCTHQPGPDAQPCALALYDRAALKAVTSARLFQFADNEAGASRESLVARSELAWGIFTASGSHSANLFTRWLMTR